jgi:DNA-binding NarL/FixJ family response regulator
VAQNAKPKISLIVADDHPIIRRYLKRVLIDYFDIEPFIETSDGSELLGSIDQTVPDLAVIDLEMPKINGYDAILEIHTRYPEIITIVFSGFLTPEVQKRVIQMGAHSTISKNETPEAIIHAFNTIINGNRYHSDVRSCCIDQKEFDGVQDDTLTVRETEIVDLIVKGYSSKKIADILGISKWTVDTHRANIRKKMGVSNVVDLVRIALKTNERKNLRE